MHPKELSIADYSYALPEEKIAVFPLPERDQARLLIYNEGYLSEDVFLNLDEHLPARTLMVFNETRVLPARLIFKKETGGVIEVFCLEPEEGGGAMESTMNRQGNITYRCLVGGASKWKDGMQLSWNAGGMRLSANVLGRGRDGFVILFEWTPPDKSWSEVLQAFGHVPLPPYLNRSDQPADRERYQSVLAKNEGSVAAPTASLHFSKPLLERLSTKGIDRALLTLHVGAGTFQPVKADRMEGHKMHAEWMDVPVTLLDALLNATGPIVAVGTTALRTLESLYWMGCKAAAQPNAAIEDLSIMQWEPYDFAYPERPVQEALSALRNKLTLTSHQRLVAPTAIIIAPGYRLRVAQGLVTNFHQPGSTLLLLVAAVIGEDWRRVYDYALQNQFRFLSYGDGSLLWFNSASRSPEGDQEGPLRR